MSEAAAGVMKDKVNGPQILDWCFKHLKESKASDDHALKTVPCNGAMEALAHFRKNKKEFFVLWSKRIAEQQIEEERKMSDGGESLSSLVEKLQASLGLASCPCCGAKGDPSKFTLQKPAGEAVIE